jgi:excisionase family DNA binding protein
MIIFYSMKDRKSNKVPRYRGEGRNEILTTSMVADYLHCHLTTVYRLAKEGRIPHFRLGGDLRFQKEAIAEWIEKGGGKTERL